ncbi:MULTISPECIES: pilus assembly protein PilV [Serratia]|uniref:pilus assembly protein PilV n=1 Tax=Serratia TaxID=613 RepID=UPI0009F459DC|nr:MULTISPECIES: pilus assembly protein PilV [Serratia]MDP8626289.1 shufflon system plasmid conjugative transfer pilus tip adhesin PilV [Serratia marcescens]MDP8675723.1 shufflon system plasmid conjugative transfer pilus tip adhesin PilV [Serratia marcescens]MDP8690726.1 shufflon system plasmid conjugative transfer pilus tip adhesin PilV [Serratia marcescens]MDP8699981.1 shufflon system plasmid conjugative transfer pilus tip adhesin PilV [Serratia marcescens]MDP8710150.1 shufflon system plasmi
MEMKIKKGFSLLELTLVLGVGTMVAFMKFQDMKASQEDFTAKTAGEQIRQIGEAVNGYINLRYDKLSTLTPSSSQSNDPGPRTCNTSECEITYQTLINEGLLPVSYSGINIYKSPYKILLKRGGTAPNYVINGLVVATTAWIEGGKTRYDLLGKAMQTAGIDSGMTQSTTVISGMQGQWQESSSNFSNITGSGLLGFRTGFNSTLYSIYLRRDGTLPMTGDLNMGGNNINNAKNITASGTGSFGGNITSGENINAAKEVIAHNGYGDTITLGGDAAGNDYEIRLGTAKPLTLYSPSAGNYTTVLQVNRNAKIDQRLGLMGYDPNELPSGWGGGLRTLDVYAAGTVGAGSGGAVNAYMNSSGNIFASNDINAGHQVNAQYVWASGNLNSNYVHSNGNIDANGRINAGEFVYINGQANIGWGCSPNGVVGRTPEGKVISCVNGVWSGSTGSPVIRTAYASAYRFPGAVAYCAGSEKVVGGGGQCNTAEGYVWLTVSRPNGDNSWYAGCDTTKNITATITVYAICQ